MEKDILITHLRNHNLTIDPTDKCKLFVPIGSIIKVNDQYAICKVSFHSSSSCLRCIGRNPYDPGEGVCATLMCTKTEREDDTEVYFDILELDERTRKEGKQ